MTETTKIIKMPCSSPDRCGALLRRMETPPCGINIALDIGKCEGRAKKVAEEIAGCLGRSFSRLAPSDADADIYVSRKDQPDWGNWRHWERVAQIKDGWISSATNEDLPLLDFDNFFDGENQAI